MSYFATRIYECVTLKKKSIVSIYVSHFNEDCIKKFSDRHKDELGKEVFLINSSSSSIDAEYFPDFEVIEAGGNVGFSSANNIGIKQAGFVDPDYFLIINPDVFLPPAWLKNVMAEIDGLRCSDVGIFTVPLFGYNFESDSSTGLVDGLGIEHSWYGRWFDISQGADVSSIDTASVPYEVSAACGALMIIHKDVIYELLEQDGFVFNESYFMYKEDIELSIRVRLLGKKILLIPSAPVYHCRGWGKDRSSSSYWARVLSARNEFKMHLKFHKCFLPYSVLKYFYVRFLERVGFKILGLFK